jgi:hypothetical protein
MRSGQIIAASAVAATAVSAFRFLPGVVLRPSGMAAFLLANWPAIAVVWLGSYGVTVLVLTTLAAFLQVSSGTIRPGWGDRMGRYAVQLAVTQYFTSMLALFALGLSRVTVETALFPVLPSSLDDSPALAACGAMFVIGLLGGLLVTATRVMGESPQMRLSAPGIRAGRLFGQASAPPVAPAPADPVADAEEQPLAVPALDGVAGAAQPPSPSPEPAPANVMIDVEQLAALIEQAQRPVLEAIKDLANSVNRLRRGLGEIKFVLQDRGSKRSTESDTASPSAAEDATNQLRAVVAAVDASVTKLGEMTLLLSASETPAVTGREAPISPGSRSRLSAELQALLRDLTSAADRGDPPG